jgi:hypothetical protein
MQLNLTRKFLLAFPFLRSCVFIYASEKGNVEEENEREKLERHELSSNC